MPFLCTVLTAVCHAIHLFMHLTLYTASFTCTPMLTPSQTSHPHAHITHILDTLTGKLQARAGEEPGELGVLRTKLLRFLATSKHYVAAEHITSFPQDGEWQRNCLNELHLQTIVARPWESGMRCMVKCTVSCASPWVHDCSTTCSHTSTLVLTNRCSCPLYRFVWGESSALVQTGETRGGPGHLCPCAQGTRTGRRVSTYTLATPPGNYTMTFAKILGLWILCFNVVKTKFCTAWCTL